MEGCQKLILDQPATVTHAGTVEHVLSPTQPQGKNVKEAASHRNKGVPGKGEVLLTEDPLDGVDILID